MRYQKVYDLTDCTEFRQTVLARPPRFVRATIVLLTVLIGTAVLWAGLTEADLVVRAGGRLRPMISIDQLADAAAEESQIGSLHGGRVIEVHVREGDEVRQRDVLIRLDTRQLDNDIASEQRTIQAAKDELQQLDKLKTLLGARFEMDQAKAEAELAQAKQSITNSQNRRTTAIQLAQARERLAADQFGRLKKLAASRAISQTELQKAECDYQEATLQSQQARLPVDDGRLLVLRGALRIIEKEFFIESAQLATRHRLKLAQLETTRLELANIELQREQSELCASSDGTVTSMGIKVGHLVEPGQVLAHLAQQRGFRIDVAVASDQVGHLRLGLPVRVKLDAFDYQKYGTVGGKVVFISPDSVSHGDSAQPSYTAKIELDSDCVVRGAETGQLKLGMTGTAEIVTGRERILALLVRSIRQSISLG